MPWVLPVVNLLSAPNPSHGGPLATRLFRTSWQDRTRHMFARAQCRPAVESHRIPPVYKVKLTALESTVRYSYCCFLPSHLEAMHPKALLASAAAILPVASALAVNSKGPYLESDAYSARAAINQRDYQRNHSPKSWAVCNDKNTVVRKEW